jgi:hypothetical protein
LTGARQALRLVLLALASIAAGCPGSGGRSGGGSGADGSADGGSDTVTGTGECAPVAWGSGLVVGQPVADWQATGYADGDGDGVVEQQKVSFSLEDVHCTGKRAMVLLVGDLS